MSWTFPGAEAPVLSPTKAWPTYRHRLRTEADEKPLLVRHDHAAMIADRLSGMRWQDVADKHGIAQGRSPEYKAHRCITLIRPSPAFAALDPETAAKVIKTKEYRLANVKELYCVELVDLQGQKSYLSHKGRTAWGIRQAQKHAADVRADQAGVKMKDLRSVSVQPH